MIARLKKQIETEIQNIQFEIKTQEEKTNKDSLINLHYLYTHATAVCESAKSLAEEVSLTLSDPDQQKQYKHMLKALKKVKKAVIFPSTENANDLLNYHDNVCYSESACDQLRFEKFWGKVKAFAGALLLVTFVVSCCFVLPVAVPYIILINVLLIMSGLSLLANGVKESNKYGKELSDKKHVHINSHSNKEKSMNFLSKLCIFGNAAKTIGDRAEDKYSEQEKLKKNNTLNSYMKLGIA